MRDRQTSSLAALSRRARRALAMAAAALIAVPFAAVPAQAEILGPDSAACYAGSGKAAALVRVTGFKNRKGHIRVQAYGSDPDKFLAKGEWITRVELPVTGSGDMDVCVPLPSAGTYAIAVRHDANGSGGSDWNDGGGFSRNPSISLLKLEPDYSKVAIRFGNAPKSLSVRLLYRKGLSIGPV